MTKTVQLAGNVGRVVTQDELAEIQQRYRVRERDWLELEIAYEGRGEAEFSTNPGTIGGPTSIRYREDGALELFQMTVNELTAEQHPGKAAQDALFVFVNALPIPGGFGFGGMSNECVRLEVASDGYNVRAAQRSDVIAEAGNDTATFRPYRVVTSIESDAEPRYWAVPLLNFTSDFFVVIEELHDHPLRTRQTSPYELVSGDVRIYHELAYQQGNALIAFRCEGEFGFIEALPDYKERQARVEAGETVATAVMVGSLPPGFDAERDQEWFPSDLITLLGLATGRGVLVPFVELRGAAGELVARLHVSIGRATGERRRSLIDESIDRSTGTLLSAFLSSEHRAEAWLRVALRHLLIAFTGDLTVEDRLSHLFRTVEGLCVGLGLNRSRPLELSDDVREQVLHELERSLDALDPIADAATSPDRERIWQLKNRLRPIQSNSPSFQTQLLELVEQVELPDAAWLRDFNFRARRTGPPLGWAAAAQAYRGRIFHAAFIDFDKFDIDNAVSFIAHLSDVLLRVIFHLIGFDGQYKPPCGAHGATTHEKPDWPKSVPLSAELLRYVH